MTDARSLTLSLGGTWHGRYGLAPCPVCQPERRRDQRGLSLGDRADSQGLLLHCFKRGCDFRAILAAAGVAAPTTTSMPPHAWRELDRRCEEDLARRSRQARDVWAEAQSLAGSPAEAYLRHRGITCALPPTLRFHPACWHASGWRLPALVALVEGAGRFAVHRIYLRPDGSGKADVEPAKAMLDSVSGAAVRLTEPPSEATSVPPAPLVVAEGIETALSLASGLLRGPATVWAALSARGLAGLRLPSEPSRLTIAADGDDAGREAARALAERTHAAGWRVALLPAPEGRDWNDVLQLRAAKGETA